MGAMATGMGRPQHFPRPVLIGAAAVLGGVMLAAGYGRFLGQRQGAPPGHPVAERALRFEDAADGAVTIRDADSGRVIEVMAPGTNAFLRATLRGLVQQRRREAQGPEIPFRLAGWRDGRLTLTDAATGRAVELEAFGSANAAVFAGILTAPEMAP